MGGVRRVRDRDRWAFSERLARPDRLYWRTELAVRSDCPSPRNAFDVLRSAKPRFVFAHWSREREGAIAADRREAGSGGRLLSFFFSPVVNYHGLGGADCLGVLANRCYPSPMQHDSVGAADRWASRALLAGGFLLGALVGVFVAPDWQRQLWLFGVDQLSFRPAAPIILACAIVGAFLARDRANPFGRVRQRRTP